MRQDIKTIYFGSSNSCWSSYFPKTALKNSISNPLFLTKVRRVTPDDKIWVGRKTVSYVPCEVCQNMFFVLSKSIYITHHKLTTRNKFWKHKLSVGWYLCWSAIWRQKKRTLIFLLFPLVHTHLFFFLPKKEKERYNYTCLSYLKEVLL